MLISTQELDRFEVLVRVSKRRLTQREAARILGVTERQLRRLWVAYKRDGAVGLVSERRGKPSLRQLPSAVRDRALALVRERYGDFRATFAH